MYAYGSILDDSRLAPSETVMQNLFFINVFDAGQSYTESEYRAWLSAAGCADIERATLPDGSSIMRACKRK